MTDFALGFEAKLNYKVGGQAGGGSWLELDRAMDVTVPMTATVADVTTRGNQGWDANVSTLRAGTIEFNMLFDPNDAGFQAIRNAFLGNTHAEKTIGLQALHKANGEGSQADYHITTFTKQENLREGQMVAVVATITLSDTPPSWISS